LKGNGVYLNRWITLSFHFHPKITARSAIYPNSGSSSGPQPFLMMGMQNDIALPSPQVRRGSF
jgi:hypothetical protein